MRWPSAQDLLDNWSAVEAKLDELYADGHVRSHARLLAEAVAATSDPNGRADLDLGAVVAYHSRITNQSCGCGVCSR